MNEETFDISTHSAIVTGVMKQPDLHETVKSIQRNQAFFGAAALPAHCNHIFISLCLPLGLSFSCLGCLSITDGDEGFAVFEVIVM